MNNNLTVLKLFVDNKDKTFTIKKVSEALRINYRIAYEEVMRLEKEGTLKITKMGNSKICSFNYKYCSKIVEIEDVRKAELFKNKDIKLICKRVKEAKSPFYILVIFGSHAKKANTKHSDIDLCLITDNPEVNKEVNTILSVTPISIHLQEFTSKHFLLMLKSKEFNVGNEIVKNNIILYGIESFYELVNNVKQRTD